MLLHSYLGFSRIVYIYFPTQAGGLFDTICTSHVFLGPDSVLFMRVEVVTLATASTDTDSGASPIMRDIYHINRWTFPGSLFHVNPLFKKIQHVTAFTARYHPVSTQSL